MSKPDPTVDFFEEGRRHAIAAIRDSMSQGVWTHQERASLLKVAVHLRQVHRDRSQQRSYYAGLISILKSHLSTPPSGSVGPLEEYETGWDWNGDEDSFGVA